MWKYLYQKERTRHRSCFRLAVSRRTNGSKTALDVTGRWGWPLPVTTVKSTRPSLLWSSRTKLFLAGEVARRRKYAE